MKMILVKQIIPVIAAAAGVLSSPQSHAAFEFGFGSAGNNSTRDCIVGNNFVVNTPVTLNELGVFAPDAPVGASIPIAICQLIGSTWTGSGPGQIVGGSSLGIADQTRDITIPAAASEALYSGVTVTSSDYNSGFNYPASSVVSFNNPGSALSDGIHDIWKQTKGPETAYPGSLPAFGAGTFSAFSGMPESTTLIAGALLFLPVGASTLRILRRNRAVLQSRIRVVHS